MSARTMALAAAGLAMVIAIGAAAGMTPTGPTGAAADPATTTSTVVASTSSTAVPEVSTTLPAPAPRLPSPAVGAPPAPLVAPDLNVCSDALRDAAATGSAILAEYGAWADAHRAGATAAEYQTEVDALIVRVQTEIVRLAGQYGACGVAIRATLGQ